VTDFRLENGIIGKAGDRMEDIADDVPKASRYLAEGPGTLDQWSDGRLWGIFLGGHSGLVGKFETVCTNTQQLMAGVATNLQTTQTRYDESEQDNTVRANDIFGDGGGADPGIDEAGGATSFGTALASAKLTTPEATQQIPEVAQHLIAHGTLLISPTYWLNKMIGAIMSAAGIHTTPIDWIVQQVTGDWQAVGKASDAFGKLGDFFTENATLVTADAGVLFRGWDGEASDQAERYFQRVVDAFTAQAAPFGQAASKYSTLAFSSSSACLALGSLIAIFTDALLVAAAAAAVVWAGGVSAALVIAALEVALADWIAIIGVINWMAVGVYGTVAVCSAIGGAVSPVETVPMPTGV